jgi:hypothetical protein
MHGVMAGESNTAQAEIVVDGIMAAAKLVCHLLTVCTKTKTKDVGTHQECNKPIMDTLAGVHGDACRHLEPQNAQVDKLCLLTLIGSQVLFLLDS